VGASISTTYSRFKNSRVMMVDNYQNRRVSQVGLESGPAAAQQVVKFDRELV
jgi:hypothetical protein